jgi:hypothetical protein
VSRTKGVIRRIADEAGLDPKTVRRALEALELTEQQAEADFANTVTVVTAWADSDRVVGHATNGRGGGGHVSELAQARAESERHRAEKMRLQNERLRGSLIDRAAATETVTRLLGDFRTALLAMNGKLAPKLVGLSDVRAISRIIDTEVRDTLTAFADEGFTAALDSEALN